MSEFREFAFPGSPAKSIVYDLDFDDAHALHQSGCQGSGCWCAGLGSDDFIKALHENVLKRAGYMLLVTPPGAIAKDSIRLSVGPGINERDESPLRVVISENRTA